MSAYNGIYTDLNGLAQLRNQAESRPQGALDEVAGQFEALFTKMMLKTMRESSLGDSLFDSSQNKQYLEMFDNQVALEMSRGRGLGLKEMLVRQLGGAVTEAQPIEQVAQPVTTNWQPASNDEFVSELLPFARQIENDLGISHRAILAQAALESGWGQHTMTRPDGSDAFNLFGIKADGSWDGERVGVNTIEFYDGVGQRERASFRAYESIGDAMADYADFIVSNPRYRDALRAGSDPHAYARELQRAGYATDPEYADKLSRIIDGSQLSSATALIDTMR
ncbi:MAG: flagellar assembly peptidoglycan hydrolase FlgJ [Gammaproteobacteria bacterium]|nr:flagellar assembly peptidoglycan hydrolase FlgJ [Gammaproteobacteria bacterium]